MMQNRARLLLISFALLGTVVGVTLYAEPEAKPKSGAATDAALERTRKMVRMLDDIYKTTVVLITDKYVTDDKSFAAGSAAVALFKEIKKKGWHEVKLLDVAGEPINVQNVPQDDFEKAAAKQLKDGKSYYEQIVQSGGKRSLRAATPIPVVMQKCVLCHPNYADIKAGAPIGMLSYNLEID